MLEERGAAELVLGSGWRAAAEVLRSLDQPLPQDLSL